MSLNDVDFDSAFRMWRMAAPINILVRKLHMLGTNAMNSASAVVGVSLEIELERLNARNNV